MRLATHLLPAVPTSLALMTAMSAGVVASLSLDPEGAGGLPDARKRVGLIKSRKDLRDFMELASKEGRTGGGRGENDRGVELSSGKWGRGRRVVAIR